MSETIKFVLILFSFIILPTYVDIHVNVGVTDENGKPLSNIIVKGENLYKIQGIRYTNGVTDQNGKFTFHWKARSNKFISSDGIIRTPLDNVNEDDRIFGGPSIVTFSDPTGKYLSKKAAWQSVFVNNNVDMFIEKRDTPYSSYSSWIKLKKGK